MLGVDQLARFSFFEFYIVGMWVVVSRELVIHIRRQARQARDKICAVSNANATCCLHDGGRELPQNALHNLTSHFQEMDAYTHCEYGVGFG
jgi:hypothetical protein